ncbi:hypothetical protein ACFCYB_15700 [Streptomyces sp. NPDC056309]|uniref:hypothetical protein n=1 Tax=unclassified Streptomyces TaxID=2593676 RepID=UPI0035D80648
MRRPGRRGCCNPWSRCAGRVGVRLRGTAGSSPYRCAHRSSRRRTSGSFRNPVLPDLPGQDSFTGQMLHVVDYRNPAPFAGTRVLVVVAESQPSRSATSRPVRPWPPSPRSSPCRR